MVTPPDKDGGLAPGAVERPQDATAGPAMSLGTKISRWLVGSHVYNASLKGPVPSSLAFQPTPLWPQDRSQASEIVAGTYTLAGQKVQTSGKVPWSIPGTSPAWQKALHGFGWLSAFHGTADPDAGIFVARFTALWVDAFSSWDETAWAPEVLGARIMNWIEAWSLISNAANEAHNRKLLKSLAEGSRHLLRAGSSTEARTGDLAVGAAIIYAGVCLFDSDKWIRDGLQKLEDILEVSLLPDGCHADRNPATLLQTAELLLSIQHLLRDSGHSAPEFLQYSADRAVTALKCFQLGDGRLAVFAGGGEGIGAHLARAIALNDSKSRAPMTLSHGGYHRLEAGPLVCVMDTGAAPHYPFNQTVHRGCLSFELSDGADRLVVNCGAVPFADPDWQTAMEATAAHSTIVVNDQNACVEAGPGDVRKIVNARIRKNEQWSAIEGQHDGYSAECDIRLFRRVFVAQSGNEVRGEDTLRGPRGARGIGAPFAARFHLHPDAAASVLQDGKSVLVRLPSGAGWRFRAAGAQPELAASIHFGTGLRRRSQQIILRGTITHDTIVRWSFERL